MYYIFCVFLFYTAYVLYYCEHGGVDLMGFKPNSEDPIFLQCFDTVGWVLWPVLLIWPLMCLV